MDNALPGRKYFALAILTRSSINSKRISCLSSFPSCSPLFNSKLVAMNSRSIYDEGKLASTKSHYFANLLNASNEQFGKLLFALL
jgi:hypothetical protein